MVKSSGNGGAGNAGPLSPAAAGAGVGSGAEDPVFALFEQLYRLGTRRDLQGHPRPLGGWDMGADEVP